MERRRSSEAMNRIRVRLRRVDPRWENQGPGKAAVTRIGGKQSETKSLLVTCSQRHDSKPCPDTNQLENVYW